MIGLPVQVLEPEAFLFLNFLRSCIIRVEGDLIVDVTARVFRVEIAFVLLSKVIHAMIEVVLVVGQSFQVI